MMSFEEVASKLRMVKTYPSHDLIIRQDLVETAMDITKQQTKLRKMNENSIPCDIIKLDTLPTRDFFIRLDDVQNVHIRILVFDRVIDKNELPKDNSVKIVGCVIFDYTNTRPMFFFGVKRNSKKLIIMPEMYFYRAKSMADIIKFNNRLDDDEKPNVKIVDKIMKIWYGLMHLMLYPSLYDYMDHYERIMYNINRNTFIMYDDYKHFPHSIKCKTHTSTEHPRESYKRRKLVWFKKGHFCIIPNTNTVVFKQPQWCGPFKNEIIEWGRRI